MEYEKIKQLMEDMGNSKLSSLDIEFPDGTKIKMERNQNVEEIVVKPMKIENVQVIDELNHQKIEEKEQEGNIVKSPMVGTFYIKPAPEADPYVEIGKEVKKGNVLCIIEAMKLMNEIESELDGKIAEIYVKDGEPVEYGKPLFRIVS